jgi:hypothetical protein
VHAGDHWRVFEMRSSGRTPRRSRDRGGIGPTVALGRRRWKNERGRR